LDDVARLVQYLQSWPIMSKIASRNDYMRMAAATQINLDLESLKRLHAAIMKAYYKVADLNGEFPVVLQDHITNASVQITLNSHNCQLIVAKAELFTSISKVLNLPHLSQLLMTTFPTFPDSEPLPSWWNNDTDLSLLRAIFTYGFIDWRKSRQDPSLHPKILPVIESDTRDAFLLSRLRQVCSHLLSPSALKPAPLRPVAALPRKVPLKQANVTSYFAPQPKPAQ
jgi:hypothetical protein